MFNQFTLGNMGGSDAICEISPINKAHSDRNSVMPLTCTSGLIQIDYIADNTQAPIFEAGIIPDYTEVSTYCTNRVFDDPAQCTSFLDIDSLKADINAKCVGQSKCSLKNMSQYLNMDAPGFN